MKKLFILTVAILIVISQFSGMACAGSREPDYPWASNFPKQLPTGATRHHIIPWEELVKFGNENYNKDEKKLIRFLDKYTGLKKANLGAYQDSRQFVNQVIAGRKDATETMEQLYAWMQGNLVVGPRTRSQDPGNKFDTVAWECRQKVVYDYEYDDLKMKWKTGSKFVKERVFETLRRKIMPENFTETMKCVGW